MEQIKTKRLTMTLASLSDLPALEEIEEECDEYFRFDPPAAADDNRSIRECLTIGDIIPDISEDDYKRANYHLYCIRKDNSLVGWLSFYLEYQQKDMVYLSVVYIKETYRSDGFGAEILDALTRKWAMDKFTKVKIHCSLRNALALRFWVKNGFNLITEVECDGNLTPGNFGSISLVKIIAPSK